MMMVVTVTHHRRTNNCKNRIGLRELNRIEEKKEVVLLSTDYRPNSVDSRANCRLNETEKEKNL